MCRKYGEVTSRLEQAWHDSPATYVAPYPAGCVTPGAPKQRMAQERYMEYTGRCVMTMTILRSFGVVILRSQEERINESFSISLEGMDGTVDAAGHQAFGIGKHEVPTREQLPSPVYHLSLQQATAPSRQVIQLTQNER